MHTERNQYDAQSWQCSLDQLNKFIGLEPDWDGEGAVPPHIDTLMRVCEWLKIQHSNGAPPPSRIVAAPDGAILVEWHDNGYFEVEISNPNYVEWMSKQGNQPIEHGRFTLPPISNTDNTISGLESTLIHQELDDSTWSSERYCAA